MVPFLFLLLFALAPVLTRASCTRGAFALRMRLKQRSWLALVLLLLACGTNGSSTPNSSSRPDESNRPSDSLAEDDLAEDDLGGHDVKTLAPSDAVLLYDLQGILIRARNSHTEMLMALPI